MCPASFGGGNQRQPSVPAGSARRHAGRTAQGKDCSGVPLPQSSSTMVMAFQLFIGMSSRFRFES